MALVTVHELLEHAQKNRYGVAAFNMLNFETVRHAVMAAENEGTGVIIQYYPGFKDFCPLSHIAFMAKDLARKASVPVAVHLDHSPTLETVLCGLRDGFPSVMVDGSSLPYEENVALTKSVVEAASVFGVDVEAELGHVGSGSNIDDMTNTDHFTDVDQAVDFVARTGCKSLAVAVGNAHGAYIRTPELDFDRIEKLRSALNMPLVLHGCSDIPDAQLQRAVNLGMCKFNIATEYFRAMYHALEEMIQTGEIKGDGVSLMMGTEKRMVEFVTQKIRLLNPNHYSIHH